MGRVSNSPQHPNVPASRAEPTIVPASAAERPIVPAAPARRPIVPVSRADGAAQAPSAAGDGDARHARHPALPGSLQMQLTGGGGLPLRAIVSGEIDYASAFSMQIRIATACRRRRARGLIVDLAGAEFISSSGLGAIMNLQREPACQCGGLVVSGPTAEVRRVLKLTGLERRLIVADTIEEAEMLLLYSAAGGDVSRHPHRDTSFS
jgi:anti-sigma B factor antagonist